MALGDVITYFNSPGADPTGLTWDGENLWVADAADLKIYKISPVDGSVISSFNSPGPVPYGLAWDDSGYLWHADSQNEMLYKLNPSTGAVIQSFSSPILDYGLGKNPTGVAFDGTVVWLADSDQKRIFKMQVPPSDWNTAYSMANTQAVTGIDLDRAGKLYWIQGSDLHWKTLSDGSSDTWRSIGAAGTTGLTFDDEKNIWTANVQEGRIYKREGPKAPAPVIQAPSPGAVVGTAIPTLQGVVTQWTAGQSKLEWQFATDAAFTADVKTVLEPDSLLRVNGSAAFVLPTAYALTQRGWYVRARQVTSTGVRGDWSAGIAFTVAHAPGATNLNPSGGKGIAYSAVVNLTWNFVDTSPTDSQSAYQVIVERNDTGALVVDTGKVLLSDQQYALAVAADLKDVTLRWRLKLWDAEDKSSSWTAYNLFITSDGPTVQIVTPTDGATIQSARPVVSWNYASSAGRPQNTYRIVTKKVGSAESFFDTGTLSGNATSYSPSTSILQNNSTFDVTVTVTDSFGIESVSTVRISVAYEAPDSVTFSIDETSYAEAGYVRLTWISSYNDPTFLKWRIYRRILGEEDWDLLGEIPQVSVTEFKDWTAASFTRYEYIVMQVVERFGEQVESGFVNPLTIETSSGSYWLVDPVDSGNNVRLSNVTEDNYSNSIERGEFIVIGRGRHVDLGQTAGVSGALVCQLRDSIDSTARAKKKALEKLYFMKKPVYLRNPFGDIILISLGDIDISRISGVGTSEFVDVTVPYMEIF